MTYKISMDPGPCTVLVECSCGWREIAPDRSAAWLAAARHLKHQHGDLQAGYNARHNAYMVNRRAKYKKRTRRAVET